VLLPYLVFFLVAGAVLTVGLIRPELVSRATFYCVVRSDVLNIFVGVFGGLCCVAAIVLEAWIALLLQKNRRKRDLRRNANQNITNPNTNHTSPSSTSTTSGMDVQLAIRVILFGFYIFFGLALSIISILNWTSVVPDLCFSTFSIAVFAIFGSQQDIMRVWKRGFCCCFIKSEQESRRTPSHVRAGSIDPDAGKFPLSPGAMSAGGGAIYQPGNDGRGGHNPYWYRGGDKKKEKMMGDLATLNTRHTNTNTIGRSPYNSHTDFQFQFESDVGLGLIGQAGPGGRAPGSLGQHPNPSQVNVSDHKAGKKSKDAWWGALAHKNNGRPGTGGSAKQQRPGTAGTVNSANFGETSMSWYPDLGYDFVPEGTSHTEDLEVEMDVNSGIQPNNASEPNLAGDAPKKRSRKDSNMSGVKGHANPHTRHSSATVPSEYIGQSPRTPEFIYYQQEEGSRSLPQLVSEMSPTSPMPLLPKTTPAQPAHAHAPAVTSRLHIEHRPSMESDTSASVSNVNDSSPHLVGGPETRPRPPRSEPHQFAQVNASYRDSVGYQSSIGYADSNGWRDSTGYAYRQSVEGEAGSLPDYYLRQYSHHQHIHSTDYRSSLDSSIGGGARAAIVRGGDPRAGNCTYPTAGNTNQYNVAAAITTSNGISGTELYNSDYREYGNTTQSDYPYTFNYQHNNMSTHALDQIHGSSSQVVTHHTQVYAPAPKSAFDKDGTGFEFISGRKRTGGADSPDSFITNPSLYGGRAY
jgi:hypothetical protein